MGLGVVILKDLNTPKLLLRPDFLFPKFMYEDSCTSLAPPEESIQQSGNFDPEFAGEICILVASPTKKLPEGRGDNIWVLILPEMGFEGLSIIFVEISCDSFPIISVSEDLVCIVVN